MVEALGARDGVEIVLVGGIQKLGVVSRPDRVLRTRHCGCGGQVCRAAGLSSLGVGAVLLTERPAWFGGSG
ncbi:MAG TPA: hypothetical protein VH228_09085, partial [Nocardioides sp.]|nr:hypothetical protein [Nocardioides sp.]